MLVIYFLIIDNNIDFNYVCYIYFEIFCYNYKIFYIFIIIKRWILCSLISICLRFKIICVYWVLLFLILKWFVFIDKYCIGGEI